MTIIKIDITNEKQLTDQEYDTINHAFKRKAQEMGILDKYLEKDQQWTIQCKIGENNES
jgi:hypothetical protein